MRSRSRRYRRRIDWFEISMMALGVLFLALAAGSVFLAVTIAVNIGDSEAGFPAGPGFIKGIKVLGILLFAVGAVVMYGVADWVFGDRIRLGVRDLIRRRRRSRHD